MNRVEAAIRDGRCVLALGGRAQRNDDVLAELRRRQVPCVNLGGEAVNPLLTLDANSLGPALNASGGIIVLIEPEPADDGRALGELAELIKASGQKPRLFIASRAFNPFALPMGLRLLKLEQLKHRAKDFLSALPVDLVSGAAPAAAAPKKKKKKDDFQAPAPTFVGREDEVAQMAEWLGAESGTAIVLTGPHGIGKRWLAEHALQSHECTRMPDLTLGRGTGADTLLARLAITALDKGDDRLHTALSSKDKRPTPAQMAELVVDVLSQDAMADVVWMIHGLGGLMHRRTPSFQAAGRLETLLSALLRAETKATLIFTTVTVPETYQAGGSPLRVLALEGLAGKTLHGLFEAHHTPECDRDRFGPIAERTLGHPMAARYLAMAMVEEGSVDEILEQPRFLKLSAIDDSQALRRHIKRKVEKLPKDVRASLAACALLRQSGTTENLQALGLNRSRRLQLLSMGLLEQTPGVGNRRYYVHPMVGDHLEYREVYDFKLMENLGRHLLEVGKAQRTAEENMVAMATCLEANRFLVDARRERSCIALPYPDLDPTVNNILGLIRRKNARLDIARQRTNEALKLDPYNTELILAHAELRIAEKASEEMILGVYTHAADTCPTEDVFLAEADHHLAKHARGKAVGALERGTRAFESSGRLHRRLAEFYLDQNRYAEAIEILVKVVGLEPTMPETYGTLGEAYMAMGGEATAKAVEVLDEALKLDPTSPRNLVRRATLARDMALAAPEKREAGLTEAETLIQAALDIDKGHPYAQAVLAAVILDKGGDLAQADWLLKQACKRKETSFALVQLARVRIRQEAFDEVEKILAKAVKRDKSNHAAYAAQAEFWEAQGQVFHAFEATKSAKERSPKDSPARARYEASIVRLQALIESGQAAELMKAADGSKATASSEATPASAGPRRDAGKTTIRRRKGKGAAEEQASEETAEAETAEAADTAEAETAEVAPEPEAETAEPETDEAEIAEAAEAEIAEAADTAAAEAAEIAPEPEASPSA